MYYCKDERQIDREIDKRGNKLINTFESKQNIIKIKWEDHGSNKKLYMGRNEISERDTMQGDMEIYGYIYGYTS